MLGAMYAMNALTFTQEGRERISFLLLSTKAYFAPGIWAITDLILECLFLSNLLSSLALLDNEGDKLMI